MLNNAMIKLPFLCINHDKYNFLQRTTSLNYIPSKAPMLKTILGPV